MISLSLDMQLYLLNGSLWFLLMNIAGCRDGIKMPMIEVLLKFGGTREQESSKLSDLDPETRQSVEKMMVRYAKMIQWPVTFIFKQASWKARVEIEILEDSKFACFDFSQYVSVCYQTFAFKIDASFKLVQFLAPNQMFDDSLFQHTSSATEHKEARGWLCTLSPVNLFTAVGNQFDRIVFYLCSSSMYSL